MAIENELFRFGDVVFFGRSIDEYVSMFDLNLEDLTGKNVLDCPSGPAAFAKQAAERNINVTACDPMYEHLNVDELREAVDHDARDVANKTAVNRELFHAELPPVAVRRQAMEVFLQDYQSGRASGRYLTGKLPALPFADKSFDMVLSANLLFIYSDIASGGMREQSPFDYDFHRQAINELIRLTKTEVRIYPLKGPGPGTHTYLGPLMQELTAASLKVELRNVTQRDIIGAEQTLIISRPNP